MIRPSLQLQGNPHQPGVTADILAGSPVPTVWSGEQLRAAINTDKPMPVYTETNHGFTIGAPIRRESGHWVQAVSDMVENLQGYVGIVSEIVDEDTFRFVSYGIVDLPNITDGSPYYIAEDGNLTTTMPAIAIRVGVGTPVGLFLDSQEIPVTPQPAEFIAGQPFEGFTAPQPAIGFNPGQPIRRGANGEWLPASAATPADHEGFFGAVVVLADSQEFRYAMSGIIPIQFLPWIQDGVTYYLDTTASALTDVDPANPTIVVGVGTAEGLYLYSGITYTPPPVSARKAILVVSLLAGDNVINHNLGLVGDARGIVDVRDSTGATLLVRVKNFTSTSFTIVSPVAMSNLTVIYLG